jgi:hypothetical protein
MDLPLPRILADDQAKMQAKEDAKLLGVLAAGVAFHVALVAGLYALCGKRPGDY